MGTQKKGAHTHLHAHTIKKQKEILNKKTKAHISFFLL